MISNKKLLDIKKVTSSEPEKDLKLIYIKYMWSLYTHNICVYIIYTGIHIFCPNPFYFDLSESCSVVSDSLQPHGL